MLLISAVTQDTSYLGNERYSSSSVKLLVLLEDIGRMRREGSGGGGCVLGRQFLFGSSRALCRAGCRGPWWALKLGEGRVCAGWSEEVERGCGLQGEELEVLVSWS